MRPADLLSTLKIAALVAGGFWLLAHMPHPRRDFIPGELCCRPVPAAARLAGR